MMDTVVERIIDNKMLSFETAKLCTLNAVQGNRVSVTPIKPNKLGVAYSMLSNIRTFENTDYSTKIGSTVLVVFLDKELSEGVVVGVIA